MTRAGFAVAVIAFFSTVARATEVCCTSAQAQTQAASPEPTLWDHNGSVMYLAPRLHALFRRFRALLMISRCGIHTFPGIARRVLTPEQRQIVNDQIRTAERLRYMENPYNAWEFTITEDDLDWPTHCPVLPWIELHYPGHYRHDPAGASLDRIDREKGYVPGNVRVISLRANLLRKDITYEELRALADFFFA
jgi:hypothetical protein